MQPSSDRVLTPYYVVFGKVWSECPWPLSSHSLGQTVCTDDPNAAELAQIPIGQLYLVRSDSVKGSRECMYVDFVLSTHDLSNV